MKIPTKIRIGKYDYDIKKTWLIDWRRKIIGQIDYAEKKIKLKRNIKDKRIYEETFFHEIAHGILKDLEFNYPSMSKFRKDENCVQEMGLMLRKTFLDLLKYQHGGKKL